MSYTQDEKSTGLELLTWSQLANGDILTVGDASDSGRLKGVLKSELQSQLDSKEPAKGADDNFVTDAEKNVISNTSGTNTGDETTSSIKSKLGISVLSGDNTGDQDLSPYQLISASAGGEVSGTLANIALLNSAVLGKVLTGLNTTGSTIASTDTLIQAFGKLQNQINGLLGGAIYQGVWNASTNSPSLVSATGTKGYYYVVSVAGSTNLDGVTDWKVGDWAIYNGTAWQKVDNTDAVSSVNGFTGAVSLTSADISEVTNLYFTTARVLATAITGFSASAGAVAASDTILQAINKIVGNIANKQDTLVSGTNIKTINGSTILGSGDLTVSGTSIEVLNTATLGSTQNNYSTGMSTSKNILTILNIIPSSSFKITGIDSTSVENGKIIRIYNQSDRLTSSGRIILFERLFSGSGSSAANRFTFPLFNGMPLILTPDSFVEFQYNTFDNYWHMVYASEWGNPNGFFDCYSDCHVNAPFLPTTATAGTVGSTSGSILSGTTQKTIGTMLHTITTNAGRSYLGTQQSAMYFGGYCALGMARVQFGALADVTDDYVSYNLFTDASGGTPFDQIGFVYNRSQSTDWRTSTVNNSTELIKTVTGFTPSTTVFHTIGAFVNGDASNVDFFYSTDNDTWTFAASHANTGESTNGTIPSGTARTLGFMTGFSKTAGSGSKTMNTDWLGYKLMMKRGV
jgi:hypothetical protein